MKYFLSQIKYRITGIYHVAIGAPVNYAYVCDNGYTALFSEKKRDFGSAQVCGA